MCLCGFGNVCVCVGVLLICYTLTEVVINLTEVFLTLTEVFPHLILISKANVRVKLAKTGHGPHSSTLVVICVVQLLFVLFYVLFVCKCVLPPGDNTTAVNKYINNYSYIKFLAHLIRAETQLVYELSILCFTCTVLELNQL